MHVNLFSTNLASKSLLIKLLYEYCYRGEGGFILVIINDCKTFTQIISTGIPNICCCIYLLWTIYLVQAIDHNEPPKHQTEFARQPYVNLQKKSQAISKALLCRFFGSFGKTIINCVQNNFFIVFPKIKCMYHLFRLVIGTDGRQSFGNYLTLCKDVVFHYNFVDSYVEHTFVNSCSNSRTE